MSRAIDLIVGGIAGVGVLAAAAVDYAYPSPDYTGIALLVTAIGGTITILGTQVVGLLVSLSKQRQTHDLVNSMSVDKLREAKEAAFAEGKLAGALEERAAWASRMQPGAQLPQVPVPKE